MYKNIIFTVVLAIFLIFSTPVSKCYAGVDDDLGIYKIKLDYYENQIKLHPKDIQNYLAKADLHLDLNQLPEARELYKKAYEISGSISMKKYLEAMILFTEYKTDEAQEKIDQLLIEEPCNPGALYLKGVIALQGGNHDKALEYFQKVLESDSNNVDAMNKIGWIYIDKADYDKALQYFNQILFRDGSYVSALDGKGYALFKIGLFKEAAPYLNEAIILLPDSWGAWATRGQIYLAMDKTDFADYCLKKAEAINPEAEEVKVLREKLYPSLPISVKAKEENVKQSDKQAEKPSNKMKKDAVPCPCPKKAGDKKKSPCAKSKVPGNKKPCDQLKQSSNKKPCDEKATDNKNKQQKQFEDAIDE